MRPEIEAKFLGVNFDVLRVKLLEVGAQCVQPMRLMRRKNFDHADGRLGAIGGWVRLRDEGDKVTLAYKQLNNRSIDGTQEISVIVSDFDDTVTLLQAAGLRQDAYQETRRESWVLGEVQIELDEWPWVRPFIEIEAADEEALYSVARKLGFKKEDAVYGSVEVVYIQEYDVTEEEVNSWPEMIFSPVPGWLATRRK